jgi:PAS domain S-box-containing protein
MLKKMFNSDTTIISIKSAEDGRYVDVNPAFTKVIGYTQEEVEGKTPEELNIILDDKYTEKMLIALLEIGKYKDAEYKVVTKSGDILDAVFSSQVIEYKDEKYIITVMTDITRQKNIEKELAYQSRLQEILMDISTKYINIPIEKIDKAINDSLRMIGEFVDADRVYIFEFDFVNRTTSNTYEWCAEGITEEIENLQQIPFEAVDFFMKEHLGGQVINIPDIFQYEPMDESRKILEAQGIKSLIAVPMMLNGNSLGFIGFDSVKNKKQYTNLEIKLLKTYAQIIVNVMERQRKEKILIEALEEKALLMNEIHHRVKNNLQVISSLLYLQSVYISDPNLIEILQNSRNRVEAMALLHEKIYQSKDIKSFNFKSYIEKIAEQLVNQYAITSLDIVLKTNIENIRLDIDQSILCGLIVNELITNALKHAFRGFKKGKIEISINEDEGTVNLSIKDNGRGLREDFIPSKNATLGIQLVARLVKQLEGELLLGSGEGTEFKITFPKK